MRLRDEIRKVLKTVDPNTYYVDAFEDDRSKPWDYIVFARVGFRQNAGYTDTVSVKIVREHYIPDGLPEKVIAAMRTLPGVRLVSDKTFSYEYFTKDNSNDVVEALTLEFTRPRLRCDDE